MTTLTFENALQIVQEANELNASPFTVNFDGLWQWCGYSRKDNAKRFLEANFQRDFDFLNKEEATTTGISAIPLQIITLTLDAAKSFAMMANTPQGKEVRKYFIEAEKKLRSIQSQPVKPPTALELARQNVTLLEQIEANKEKVEIGELVMESERKMNMRECAAALTNLGYVLGRNQLYKALRKVGMFGIGSTMPYRNFIDDGCFECGLTREGRTYTLVTQKGFERILKYLKKPESGVTKQIAGTVTQQSFFLPNVKPELMGD